MKKPNRFHPEHQNSCAEHHDERELGRERAGEEELEGEERAPQPRLGLGLEPVARGRGGPHPLRLGHVHHEREEDDEARDRQLHIELLVECAQPDHGSWRDVARALGPRLRRRHVDRRVLLRVEDRLDARVPVVRQHDLRLRAYPIHRLDFVREPLERRLAHGLAHNLRRLAAALALVLLAGRPLLVAPPGGSRLVDRPGGRHGLGRLAAPKSDKSSKLETYINLNQLNQLNQKPKSLGNQHLNRSLNQQEITRAALLIRVICLAVFLIRVIRVIRHPPRKIGRKLKTNGESDNARSNFRGLRTRAGTVIGNEKRIHERIFVGRNFSVFQNRARWPTSGGFVMLPDRAEPNTELRMRNAELPEDPSDCIVLLFANSHYGALLAANKPD